MSNRTALQIYLLRLTRTTPQQEHGFLSTLYARIAASKHQSKKFRKRLALGHQPSKRGFSGTCVNPTGLAYPTGKGVQGLCLYGQYQVWYPMSFKKVAEEIGASLVMLIYLVGGSNSPPPPLFLLAEPHQSGGEGFKPISL